MINLAELMLKKEVVDKYNNETSWNDWNIWQLSEPQLGTRRIGRIFGLKSQRSSHASRKLAPG